MEDRGLEPGSFSSEKSPLSDPGKAQSEASGAPDAPPASDPDLALLANTWPSIPLADRQAILVIVRRATR